MSLLSLSFFRRSLSSINVSWLLTRSLDRHLLALAGSLPRQVGFQPMTSVSYCQGILAIFGHMTVPEEESLPLRPRTRALSWQRPRSLKACLVDCLSFLLSNVCSRLCLQSIQKSCLLTRVSSSCQKEYVDSRSGDQFCVGQRCGHPGTVSQTGMSIEPLGQNDDDS